MTFCVGITPPPYFTVYACKLKQSNVLVVKNTMSFIVCTFNLLSLCYKCNAVFKHYVYFVSFTNMSYFFLGFLLGAIFPEVVNFNYAYVLGILFIFVWEVYYNRLPKQKCIITMQINKRSYTGSNQLISHFPDYKKSKFNQLVRKKSPVIFITFK